MDAEEVCFRSFGLRVQGCSTDDEDSGVDEQREAEETCSQLDNGVLETTPDSVDARAVFLLVVEGLRAMQANRFIKLAETWLDDATA